jgi:beta-lactam-binding protein with PASTA domain
MRLGTRVWTVGKFFVLLAALGATFLICFGIALRVALRARQVQVPSLVGSTVSEATEQLSSLGLGLSVDKNTRPDETVEAGHVMQQDPPAGAGSRRQRTVRVWVSSGPKSATVPPLVGQSEQAARVRLQEDGVAIGSIAEFRSADYPAGAIVSQHPPVGSQASEVSLLLNRGERSASYIMPDVIGLDGEQAADRLRRSGFRVSIVGTQPYPGVPPGTVVRQVPASGFEVGARDAISLEVSQ